MKKKFFNAKIYRNPDATEMSVENGKLRTSEMTFHLVKKKSI